jgi:hypothetical protein
MVIYGLMVWKLLEKEVCFRLENSKAKSLVNNTKSKRECTSEGSKVVNWFHYFILLLHK